MTSGVGTRNEDVFATFFREHVPSVRGYVRTLVTPSEVDHVVSATFATAWQKFDLVQQVAAKPWLFAVARNHVRNTVRAEQRRTALVGTLADLRPTDVAGLFEGSLDPGVTAMLAAALGRMTDDEREVLQLAAWHGLQPVEIAQVLRIDANAARVRLHRARKRLQSLLAELAEADTDETAHSEAKNSEGGAR